MISNAANSSRRACCSELSAMSWRTFSTCRRARFCAQRKRPGCCAARVDEQGPRDAAGLQLRDAQVIQSQEHGPGVIVPIGIFEERVRHQDRGQPHANEAGDRTGEGNEDQVPNAS